MEQTAPDPEEGPESLADRLAAEYLLSLEEGGSEDLGPWLARLPEEAQRLAFQAAVEGARRVRSVLPRNLRTGAVVADRYEVREEVGAGGMGRVFAAWDRQLERRVALKVLSGLGAGDPSRQELFLKESRLLAALQHPGIVAVHEAGRDGEFSYIVMDLVDGPNLAKVIRSAREAADGQELREGRRRSLRGADLARAIGLPVGKGHPALIEERSWCRSVAAIACELARTIEAAHGAGVVHRDLKPSNLILLGGGRPVVLDFGLAGSTDPAQLGEVTQGLYGSVAYLAPEQVRSSTVGNDPRTDIYQLGLILYELLSLQRAFPGDLMAEALQRIQSGIFKTPRQHDPEVPRDLEAICLKAMELDPGRRYATAEELRADLERYLDGQEPRAARASRLRSLWRTARFRARRHPAISTVAGMAAVALVGVVLQLTVLGAPAPLAIEGAWRLPMEGEPARLAQGETVAPGDVLGFQIDVHRRAHVYALSIFRGPDDEEPQVLPYHPMTIEEFVSGLEPSGPWGRRLPEGEHKLVLTSADAGNVDEGLLVFASPYDEPALEDWMASLEDQMDDESDAYYFLGCIPWSVASQALPALAGKRGRSLEDMPDEERVRYRSRTSLTPAQLRGEEEWPLTEVRRFEQSFRVEKSDG